MPGLRRMQRNGGLDTVAGMHATEQTLCQTLLWNLKIRFRSKMVFPEKSKCIHTYVNTDLYISRHIRFVVL